MRAELFQTLTNVGLDVQTLSSQAKLDAMISGTGLEGNLDVGRGVALAFQKFVARTKRFL